MIPQKDEIHWRKVWDIVFLSAIVALCLAQGARAEERIAVTVPAILDPAAPIAEGVKHSCGVEAKVGEEIFLRISERFPGTEKTRAPQTIALGRTVVKVTILGVLGPGGGGWSGFKSISIRADVMRNAKMIVSRILNRTSSGGIWGGISGTCPIMDRIAVALGRDVAAWLPAGLASVGPDSPRPDEPAIQLPKESSDSPAAPEQPEGEAKK
jgi:hypothetical protein